MHSIRTLDHFVNLIFQVFQKKRSFFIRISCRKKKKIVADDSSKYVFPQKHAAPDNRRRAFYKSCFMKNFGFCFQLFFGLPITVGKRRVVKLRKSVFVAKKTANGNKGGFTNLIFADFLRDIG